MYAPPAIKDEAAVCKQRSLGIMAQAWLRRRLEHGDDFGHRVGRGGSEDAQAKAVLHWRPLFCEQKPLAQATLYDVLAT